jgi:hypothetical protein
MTCVLSAMSPGSAPAMILRFPHGLLLCDVCDHRDLPHGATVSPPRRGRLCGGSASRKDTSSCEKVSSQSSPQLTVCSPRLTLRNKRRSPSRRHCRDGIPFLLPSPAAAGEGLGGGGGTTPPPPPAPPDGRTGCCTARHRSRRAPAALRASPAPRWSRGSSPGSSRRRARWRAGAR